MKTHRYEIDERIAYKATAIIKSVTEALEAGTKHFSIDGKPLNTPMEVVQALIMDKRVILKPKETNKSNQP